MRHMSGQQMIGNKNGLKLKDPIVRQQAYESYCAHLAKGKSKRSWVFEHPDHSCTWETLETYLKDETEFDPVKKKVALSQGFAKWEEVCEESANGKNQRANTASLQMVMRNKFGWDKIKPENSEHRGDISRIANGLRYSSTQQQAESSDSDIQQSD